MSATQKIVKKVVKKVEDTPVPVAAPAPLAAPAPVAAPAAETPVAEKKTRARKEKAEGDAEPAERKVVTQETVNTDMDELLKFVTDSIADPELLRKATKVLRGVASRVRRLRADVTRVVKKSTKSSAPKDKSKMSNSGLMKPVKITDDLAQFMNVPKDSLQSRVAVTNAICLYVKTHALQNPENKREIRPDAVLAKLLGYSGDKTKSPLTYFYVQQLIQPHFVKTAQA